MTLAARCARGRQIGIGASRSLIRRHNRQHKNRRRRRLSAWRRLLRDIGTLLHRDAAATVAVEVNNNEVESANVGKSTRPLTRPIDDDSQTLLRHDGGRQALRVVRDTIARRLNRTRSPSLHRRRTNAIVVAETKFNGNGAAY